MADNLLYYGADLDTVCLIIATVLRKPSWLPSCEHDQVTPCPVCEKGDLHAKAH